MHSDCLRKIRGILMEKMKKYYLLFVAVAVMMFLLSKVNASEHLLTEVQSDDTPKNIKLVLNYDDEEQIIKNIYKDTYIGGVQNSRERLNLEEILEHGLVIEEINNQAILKLRSENFDYHYGGTIVVDTLYNYATGKRKNYEIDLSKYNATWELLSAGRAFKTISIELNRVSILGVVGIKNLLMR